MIYEMVRDRYQVLESQWQDLSAALQRLAAALDDIQPPLLPADILAFGDPDPQAPPVGLQNDTDQQAQNVAAATIAMPPRQPAFQLFTSARDFFLANEQLMAPPPPPPPIIVDRQQVEAAFNGRVGLLPAAVQQLVEVAHCRIELDNLRIHIANCLQDFEEILTMEGAHFNIRGIRGSVEDIASYPILTTDLGSGGSMLPSSGGGTATGVSLKRTVEVAVREVLGRVPKTTDVRSFSAALTQSFQIIELDGHTGFKWTPRTYAGQTELGGGVTGAQASLYARAKVAADNALPLLDGFYPLIPDADDEEIEAVRAIVGTLIKELVNELATEGGPRIARVDGLFDALLTDSTTGIGGQVVVGGKLGYMQQVFGLEAGQVNTLEEEATFSNFILLQDYVTSLQTSWNAFRTNQFGRDLGTRFVLLSRALSVVAEGVREVYAAMDSVFVGSSERQVARFRLAGGQEVLVAELLSWIESFATDEAPELVHQGGRRGVETIIPTTQTLLAQLNRFMNAIGADRSLPEGLRHPRVIHPLRELGSYLGQVQQLALNIRTP